MGKPRRPAPVVGKRKGVSGSGGGGSMKRKVGAGAKHAAVNKAKGKATKPVRPPSYVENREEEYEVGEEDLAFFDEHAGFAAGFLKR